MIIRNVTTRTAQISIAYRKIRMMLDTPVAKFVLSSKALSPKISRQTHDRMISAR